MKIAIIAWGSIIWDPQGLPKEGIWLDDGPELKIEFSRISKNARLTLVIDTIIKGSLVRTKHVLSPRTSIDDAVQDLVAREETTKKNIGWVNLTDETSSKSVYPEQADVHETIAKWCKQRKYEGAVWTALLPSFEKNMGKVFSTDEALSYLRTLPINVRKEAIMYIRKTPSCVQTEFRRRAEKEIDEQAVPAYSEQPAES